MGLQGMNVHSFNFFDFLMSEGRHDFYSVEFSSYIIFCYSPCIFFLKYTSNGRDNNNDRDEDEDDATSFVKGIDIHADEANINVNFWITPDEARIAGGGLIVYDRAAPQSMNFEEMNEDQHRIRQFLINSETVLVPYKSNRMVLFDSRLFHQTEDFTFSTKNGFTSSRINLTFLYGER